jgi:hypothetical protein
MIDLSNRGIANHFGKVAGLVSCLITGSQDATHQDHHCPSSLQEVRVSVKYKCSWDQK